MKATILALSLVFNLIALSVFGYFLHQKGGLPYLGEKATQTWVSLRGQTAPAAPATDTSLATILLLPPETQRGKPLMQALRERKSERSFADRPLTLQELSNLLWAADGINRKNGGRTAPSARNVQEFDLYVILREGIYVYEPKQHHLQPVTAGDHRKSAGNDGYVATAPLNLIYVADLAKVNWTSDLNVKIRIASLDVGFIAENVALFCSSEGLNSVPRLSIDTDSLAAILKLRPDQKIILATTVGPPK